ncbi:MAG TPA: hypothetical protein ENI49_04000, partial [Thermoplasmatales archaeon]|nr:hypothetical protein [Thermoplasmatales archaeon]
VFVGANKQFFPTIKLKYSQLETVDNIDEIKHPLFRESLRYVGIENGIELTSLADVVHGTGLGQSGAFLVALLNTLYLFKGRKIDKRTLASEACTIEIDILKEHEGKQDKYVSAFGGIKAYTFHKDDRVSIAGVLNDDILLKELQNKLLLFFTGQSRTGTTSDALKEQDEKTKKGDKDLIEKLHEIKKIGLDTLKCFEKGDLDEFGYLLDYHWQIKKQYSPHSTNKFIDKCYAQAKKSGAYGGKIMGAGGGGGCFMFYHPGTEKEKWHFISDMERLGLHHMPFTFDTQGVVAMQEDF